LISSTTPTPPATPALSSRESAWPIGTVIAIALAVACIWFFTLDARHLLRSDEGRYAEIAREMLASGDWITTRYNGLPYFEKPPLQIWMTALAFKFFGIGEWQARLWVATVGAAGMIVTWLAARRWFGERVGWLSALVLLTAPGWNLAAHFNSLDMGVSGALAFVLAGVLMAQHPAATASERRNWMLTAWAAMAVAVLTKGLIGIALPGLVLVVYSLVARDLSLWKRLNIVPGALLFLLVAAPWFVLVSQRNPAFLEFFFVHEHFQRFLTTTHHRTGPPWYFVLIVGVGFLPWLGLGWRMVKEVRHEKRDEMRSDPRGAALRPKLLLAMWAGTIFVFFSLSSSKLPGYIVPVFPALAVLAALALERIDAKAWKRNLMGAAAFLALAAAAAMFMDLPGGDAAGKAQFAAYVPWLLAACGVGLAGVALAWSAAMRQPALSVAVYALALFVAATVLLRGHEVFGRASSGVDLVAPAEAAMAGRELPIYSVRLLDHTLPFYLRRTTLMVEAPDELEFGVGQEPDKWLPTVAAFEARWRSGTPALALMARDTYANLRAANLPMVTIAEDARRVVVANFEPRRTAPFEAKTALPRP